MSDNDDPENQQSNGDDARPAGLTDSQVAMSGNDQPQPPSSEQSAIHHDPAPSHKTRLREIRRLDAINAGVGVAMLLVAIVALIVASDTSDIKHAVNNISTLATQTKREADALNEQLTQIRRQADALAAQVDQMKRQAKATENMAYSAQGQLAEIRKQTVAISYQTRAITASSGAQAQAADAQRKMADITARAQKPDVDLMELSISGLKSAPDKDGGVTVPVSWRFRNSGGSALAVVSVEFGLWFGAALPNQMPKGTFVGGNDVEVLPQITSAFSLRDPWKFVLKKKVADAVSSRTENLFFFAVFRYRDKNGDTHYRCFGRQFIFKSGDDNSDFAVPAGGSAYQCRT